MWIELTTFVGAVLALAIALQWTTSSGDLRFAQYTNALYVWPAVACALRGADLFAAVLTWTFAASVLHHGCELVHHHGPGPHETYVLLLTGLAAVAIAYVYRSGSGSAVAIVVALLLLTSGIVLLYGVAYSSDGCAGGNAMIWSAIDYFTAISAAVYTAAYVMQLPEDAPRQHGDRAAVFWLIAVLALVLSVYATYAHLSHAQALCILAVLFAVSLVAWLVLACGTFSGAQRRDYWSRYNAYDAVAAALLLALAVFLWLHFAGHADMHGWWHVVSAAAVYLAFESVTEARRLRRDGGDGGSAALAVRRYERF